MKSSEKKAHKRQSTRIPWNDAGLYDKRKGEDIYVQLHQQIAHRISIRQERISKDTSCITFV